MRQLLNRMRRWVRSVVRRRELEREMQEEMAEHLERSKARLMERGLSAEDARREAAREFGNLAYLQEEARDARGSGWVDTLRADCRFALRHFARKLGTTITMFVVLVGGMSISTLLFSYVHAYAKQPPPGIAREDDLVRIRGSRSAGGAERGLRPFDEAEFLEYRKLTDLFRSIAGFTDLTVTIGVGDDADRRGLEARATFVTEDYFSVLGIRPAVGRGLSAPEFHDASMAAAAVIANDAWERLFDRSPNAIGSTLVVNGVSITVVGVAPERFPGFPGYRSLQLWMPLPARRLVTSDVAGGFRAIARLRAGVSMSTASAAVEAVAARTAESDREIRALDPSADVVPLLAGNSDPMFDRDVRLMSAAVGLLGLLVLLIACTNVSALLTGLATARRQEIAIRLSLGAARARLIRQLLTESALLAALAGATALAIVWAGLRAAMKLLPELPFQIPITWPATTFTLAVALAVGVLFGLSPALHATRLGLASALRDSAATISATRGRLQRGLVVAQIAFTQPLIVALAAVLVFVFSQVQLRQTQSADRLISVSFRYRESVVGGSSPAVVEARQKARASVRRLLDKIDRMPGVEGVMIGWGFGPELGPYVVHRTDRVDGAATNAIELSGQPAAANFFEVMGIRLIRGRAFAPTEVSPPDPKPTECAVIVGADLARRLWAGADPIGRRLQAASDSTTGARTLVVVGVFDDPTANARKAGDAFPVYLPPDTTTLPGLLYVRTSARGQSVVPSLRDAMQEVMPEMPPRIRTLADIDAGHIRTFRMVTTGLTVAGMIALFLSAIGLYAVVAFSVGQRTREIAVRMAVGARGGQIVKRFVSDGLRLSAIGLALGLPISLIGLQVLMTNLDDDIPRVALGPVTALAALGVTVVAIAAAWIPARRAAAVDPAITLRSQ